MTSTIIALFLVGTLLLVTNAQYCPPLVIAHASSVYYSGAYAIVTCSAGYVLSSPFLPSCDLNPQTYTPVWRNVPTCNAAAPPPPPPPPPPVQVAYQCPSLSDAHGTFTFSSAQYLVGTTATLTCASGYSLSSTTPATCASAGWTNIPTCNLIYVVPPPPPPVQVVYHCPALANDAHGTWTFSSNDYIVGTTATLVCASGYIISHTSPVVCTSSGWSPVPTCNAVYVPPPPPPPVQTVFYCDNLADAHGTFTFSAAQYIVGTTATLVCISGYGLSSNSPATCSSSGWTNVPTCNLIYAQPPPPPPPPPPVQTVYTCDNLGDGHGTFTFSNSQYIVGTTATLVCSSGYGASSTTPASCTATGWINVPTCNLIYAQPPPPPPPPPPVQTVYVCDNLGDGHGTFAFSNNQYIVGTTATLTCASGYGASSSSPASCTSTGWINVPTCNQIYVAPPPPPPPPPPVQTVYTCSNLADAHGTFQFSSAQYTVGTTATLTCSSGYGLSSNSPASCTSTGWIGVPTCDLIYVAPPPPPVQASGCDLLSDAHGTFTYSSSTRAVGSTATLTCTSGFQPSHPTTTCLSSGWAVIPTCDY